MSKQITKVGRVKWFNEEKGFGFFAPHDRSADEFLHVRALDVSGVKTLLDGDEIEVEAVPGPKGLRAERIRLLNPAT
jgi:cold shock protein